MADPMYSAKHYAAKAEKQAQAAAASAASVDADKIKRIAYENYHQVQCSGAVTVQLTDTNEIYELFINNASTITFDLSQLTYPKFYYTFQVRFCFPSGAKTVTLANPLFWIAGIAPDFSDGKWHWVVFRRGKTWATNQFLGSDAGTEN